MSSTPPPPGLLNRLMNRVRVSDEADRRANPHRYIGTVDGLGPNFLFVENVARMLACTVDHVRRIPRRELPASRVHRLIYARADVEAYILRKRDTGTDPTALRHKQSLKAQRSGDGTVFDPVAKAQALTRRKR
jgi:hypothetical protein